MKAAATCTPAHLCCACRFGHRHACLNIERLRLIEHDSEVAQGRRTGHLCMKPRCLECGNNTQIQMARNRMEAMRKPG